MIPGIYFSRYPCTKILNKRTIMHGETTEESYWEKIKHPFHTHITLWRPKIDPNNEASSIYIMGQPPHMNFYYVCQFYNEPHFFLKQDETTSFEKDPIIRESENVDELLVMARILNRTRGQNV